MLAYQRAVESGEPVRVEYDVAPLGRWYDTIIVHYGGELFAVLCDDTTARKQSEVALQASEACYHSATPGDATRARRKHVSARCQP